MGSLYSTGILCSFTTASSQYHVYLEPFLRHLTEIIFALFLNEYVNNKITNLFVPFFLTFGFLRFLEISYRIFVRLFGNSQRLYELNTLKIQFFV